MSRWSAVLMVFSLLMLGCVDTAKPTGPVPMPPPDEGEFTSAVGTEAGNAGSAEGARTRLRSGASR